MKAEPGARTQMQFNWEAIPGSRTQRRKEERPSTQRYCGRCCCDHGALHSIRSIQTVSGEASYRTRDGALFHQLPPPAHIPPHFWEVGTGKAKGQSDSGKPGMRWAALTGDQELKLLLQNWQDEGICCGHLSFQQQRSALRGVSVRCFTVHRPSPQGSGR